MGDTNSDAETPESDEVIDALLPPAVRQTIEDRWWRPVEVGASLGALRLDDGFLAEPAGHPALFADHGVVHVRDISRSVVALAELADGLLLPRRPAERQEFMVGAAVMATYLHDIGMYEPSPVGRRVHALFGAQVPFTAEADDVIASILEHRGAVVRRLEAIDAVDPFAVPVELVLRELWSLNMAHSKSTVPPHVLNDPSRLRSLMQRCVFTPLEEHRRRDRTPLADDAAEPEFHIHTGRYRDPHDSFAWLSSGAAGHVALVHDVIDGLRILRAADALRQRGTTLRTAAGYEIFVDVSTGDAVYALREEGNHSLHLLRVNWPYTAGEANLRLAVVTPRGDLRIAVNRGAFQTDVARERMTDGTADVVIDIALDVLLSFDHVESGDLPAPARAPATMQAMIERPADNPRFADDVVRRVLERRPDLAGRVRAVSDVEDAAPRERARYLTATPVAADSDLASRIVDGMATRGMNVAPIDRNVAFDDVRIAEVSVGEVVVDAGSPPMFVYVPMGDGLEILPEGGYAREAVPGLLPLGVTGAVRRAERNASIVANAAVEVVIIPSDAFVRHWFQPWVPDELAAALAAVSHR